MAYLDTPPTTTENGATPHTFMKVCYTAKIFISRSLGNRLLKAKKGELQS